MQTPATSPAAEPATGFNLQDLISSINALKEAGSIFDTGGTNSLDLIRDGMERLGNLLEAVLPDVVEGYKMKKVPTDDLSKLPNTEYVPALAGPLQQPARQGGDTASAVESQTLQPIELDMDSDKGEGEKEI